MNSQNNNNGLLWAAAGFTAFLAARALYRNINKYSFSDKTVLITGASRGLGLVLARQLAAEGAKLAICARDVDELETARREFAGMGAEVMTITCDVTDRNQVHEMISSIRERFGGIDVLINNAGVIQVGPMESMTLHEYEETMKTHFWAPLYTMLAVIPHMKEQGAGRIINISSVGGKISLPHLVPYSASKFALVGLSEGMHAELKKDGIVVTTVCPGLTRTGSPRNVIVKGQHEKEYAWFKTADSLPFMTMDAEQTAYKILEASRQGDAELVTTLSGKFITAFHGFFPGATSELLGIVNKILPAAGGIGSTERKKGYESESGKSETIATVLTDKAAQKNNEMGASK
ncbi:SDR family oxidoreductase [Rhodocytophaga aerolata]|uniref:SDR family oxidoreductase n=1 Tax=Rhodocytophaga aerolata TaxID=455078 RepID=A0ABT8R630_9BACT|nr:SDR family oxidoreductase [Rhodocytophaga aerolata]MDO1447557.1 SDR family oxidoreductase [Rhodocytophaga aerolata]